MSNHMESGFGYLKSKSNQTCTFCGAIFHVEVPGQKGHEEPEKYYCPECSAEYQVRASNSPRVTLVSPRTDSQTKKNPKNGSEYQAPEDK